MSRYVTPDDSDDPGELRYRLYRLCECIACDGIGKINEKSGDFGIKVSRCAECRGEGRQRELVATATDPESLGVAVVTLAREGDFEECPIGILDTQPEPGGKKWLVKPWLPSARNVSDAGRTLQQARKGKT